MEGLLNVFIAALVIPAVVGGLLLLNRQESPDRGRCNLRLMAGLMTLKPILTTPLWYVINDLSRYSQSGPFLSVLPGAVLTVIAWIVFRPIFTSCNRSLAWKLLIFDCLRWLSTLAVGGFGVDLSSMCLVALIALAMPSIFAGVALPVAMDTYEKRIFHDAKQSGHIAKGQRGNGSPSLHVTCYSS